MRARLQMYALSAAVAATGACVGDAPNDPSQDPGDGPNVSALVSTNRVQAEDYKAGGEGVGYHDTTKANLGHAYRTDAVDIEAGGTGYDVGWTVAGEWLAYDVTFATAGSYTATLSMASTYSDQTLHVEIDGANVSGTLALSGTSWTAFSNVAADLGTLSAGVHTVKVVFDSGHVNLDYFDFASKFVSKYPGDPAPGTVFWGAAISGNGDPVARDEQPSGHPLALHRTYYQWSQRTGSMITTAKDDVAHHRLAWVSIKPPAPPSWADMGNGVYDAQIDEMLNALKTVPGPVWLTVHHEPEGGGGVNAPDDPGGPAAHIAMNRRVRMRMTALGVKNVALAPILMSYSFTTASGRNPNDWWAPGIYDFFGVDHYEKNDASIVNPTWTSVRAWAAGKGVDVAVGEWGIHGSDTAAGGFEQQWYESAISSATDRAGARVVGLSAFDSNLNSTGGGWELMGSQLTTFWDLLGDPRTATIDHLP